MSFLKKIFSPFMLEPQKKKSHIQMQDFSFSLTTWGKYENNISKWMLKNKRDQWKNATYSSKPLYRFPWTNDIPVTLHAEPKNRHDSHSIQKLYYLMLNLVI